MQVSYRNNFNHQSVLSDKERKHSRPSLPQLNNFNCNNKNLPCQRLSENVNENDFQNGDIQTVLCGLLKILYPMTILTASAPWH